MKHSYVLRVCVVGLIACISPTLFVGCGSERQFDRDATVKVIGKLLVDGKLVEPPMRVSIKAIAEDAEVVDGVKVKSAGAWAAPDGSFELSTYLQGDGVRAGKYAITFKVGQIYLMTGGLGPDILKGKYSDPDTSEYSVTVTGSETEPIDLRTIDLPTPTDTPTPE